MHYRLLSLVASTNGYCLLVCYLSLFIYLKIIMAFINSPCMCTSRKDIVYSCKHDSIFYETACKITRRPLSYSLHIRRSNKKGSSIENINTKLFWVKYSCIIVFNVYFRFNRKANHRRAASFFSENNSQKQVVVFHWPSVLSECRKCYPFPTQHVAFWIRPVQCVSILRRRELREGKYCRDIRNRKKEC